MLFFEFVRLIKELKPKYFLLENVVMKQEYQDVISKYLGCKPIRIDSALVSAQTRKRLYWTNIPNVTQPEDKGIVLKDILKHGMAGEDAVKHTDRNRRHLKSVDGKSLCATATMYKGAGNNGTTLIQVADEENCEWRKLTVLECERLQTLPNGYTLVLDEKGNQLVSNSQRYKMIGNGWTIDVITHILKNII